MYKKIKSEIKNSDWYKEWFKGVKIIRETKKPTKKNITPRIYSLIIGMGITAYIFIGYYILAYLLGLPYPR
jgi:hypothetical protein